MRRWLLAGLAVVAASCAPQDEDPPVDESVPVLRRAPTDAATQRLDVHTMMKDSILRMDSLGGVRGVHTMAPARDADQMFLRMMSDHHEGLVQIALQAMQRGTTGEVRREAERLYHEHAARRDSMVAMLERVYEDEHLPTPLTIHRIQLDSLAAAPEGEHDRMFYRVAIEHQWQAIMLIDHVLPRLGRTEVREMAETLRAEHQRETRALQEKLSRS